MTDAPTLNTYVGSGGGSEIPILHGARRSGKTKMIIDWFLKDPMNRGIITVSEARAKDIIHRIAEMHEDLFFYVTERPPADVWHERVPQSRSTWRVPMLAHLRQRVGRMDVLSMRGERRREVMIDQADHLLQNMLGAHRLAGVTWDA